MSFTGTLAGDPFKDSFHVLLLFLVPFSLFLFSLSPFVLFLLPSLASVLASAMRN